MPRAGAERGLGGVGGVGKGVETGTGVHEALAGEGSEREFGGGGDYSVSEEAQSVHPIGNPIIFSTNDGANGPAIDIGPLVACVISSPRRAIASSVFDCWLDPLSRKLSSFAHGVGSIGRKNEHPLPLVRCADFARAEYSPRDRVTQLFQIADDAGESHRDVALDVLKEDNGRSN